MIYSWSRGKIGCKENISTSTPVHQTTSESRQKRKGGVSKTKQVRVCTLPLPLCPSVLSFLSTETGESCSDVPFST